MDDAGDMAYRFLPQRMKRIGWNARFSVGFSGRGEPTAAYSHKRKGRRSRGNLLLPLGFLGIVGNQTFDCGFSETDSTVLKRSHHIVREKDKVTHSD